MWNDNNGKLSDIVGAVVEGVRGLNEGSDEVFIDTDRGTLKFYHEQDCCEAVWLQDLEYDNDLIGATVLTAEEVSGEIPEQSKEDYWDDSQTWTFYKIETTKGGIWMRWLGESNGYYSESVDLNFTPRESGDERV